MSDKSWEPDLTLSHSLPHSHSLSFTHSRHTEQLLFSCLCSKVTLSLSHYLTLSMSHSHTLTLSLSHSLTLDMLNNFCFHVYAQKSLFIAENCNGFFNSPSTPDPVSLDVTDLVPSERVTFEHRHENKSCSV